MYAVVVTWPLLLSETVATARSDRGCGSIPVVEPVLLPIGAMVGDVMDWMPATVEGDPPPKTTVRLPIVAAAASCTTLASLPATSMAPVPRSTVETSASEEPCGVRPPRIVNPAPLATTASRDTGALSDHGSTPASIEDGAVAGRGRWLALAECVESFGLGATPPPERLMMTPASVTATTPLTTSVRRRRRWRRRVRAAALAEGLCMPHVYPPALSHAVTDALLVR